MSKQKFEKLNNKIAEYLVDISTLRDNLKEKEEENLKLKKDIANLKSKAEKLSAENYQIKDDLEKLKKELHQKQV